MCRCRKEVGATATNIIVLIASLAGSVISGIAVVFGAVESYFKTSTENDAVRNQSVTLYK
jgi:hypothetical protein